MSSPHAAVAAAQAHRAARGPEIVAEFLELLSLPNVSRHQADVAAVADHIVTMLTERRVEARTVTLPGANPVVVGRYDVTDAAGTIGIYAHYDGQPIDQPDWHVEPFKPTVLSAAIDEGGVEVAVPFAGDEVDPEWRIYARAAADDKAPLLAVCAALDALQSAEVEPANNVVFLFEGEEEIGSPHLAAYMTELQPELAAADLWLICDGPVHQTRRPQVVFGVRGIAEMEITVYGPTRPLHSGHYGNWARNPVMELAQLLATMKDDRGNVVVADFYTGTQEITAADRAAVAALPDDDESLRVELGIGHPEGDGEPLALRLLRPSLNIRGLEGGAVGSQAANVIPTHAQASIDIRLAPGNDPDEMTHRVTRHMEGLGWHVVESEPDPQMLSSHARVARIESKSNYPGVRVPTDSPMALAVIEAAAAAAGGTVVAVPTFGGSVPLHHFTTILGAPIAITPFANHDNNQHAANENLRIANLWYGVDLLAALMSLELP